MWLLDLEPVLHREQTDENEGGAYRKLKQRLDEGNARWNVLLLRSASVETFVGLIHARIAGSREQHEPVLHGQVERLNKDAAAAIGAPGFGSCQGSAPIERCKHEYRGTASFDNSIFWGTASMERPQSAPEKAVLENQALSENVTLSNEASSEKTTPWNEASPEKVALSNSALLVKVALSNEAVLWKMAFRNGAKRSKVAQSKVASPLKVTSSNEAPPMNAPSGGARFNALRLVLQEQRNRFVSCHAAPHRKECVKT